MWLFYNNCAFYFVSSLAFSIEQVYKTFSTWLRYCRKFDEISKALVKLTQTLENLSDLLWPVGMISLGVGTYLITHM